MFTLEIPSHASARVKPSFLVTCLRFLEGFYALVPQEIISIFNENELELLISGMPDIDVDDWRANTVYSGGGYTASSPQVGWK